MRINEVCRKCSLTKKAVEYYIKQELISPAVQKNGYRNFSEEDVSVLKKVSVLRGLGLSVADIRSVLSSDTEAALTGICYKKTLQMAALQEQQKLMQELAAAHDWEEIQGRLRQLQEKQTILERFMNAFPGCYGKFLCLHFAPYLNEPVLTEAQQKAFAMIISFLDSVAFDLPDDLKKYLNEITLELDEQFTADMAASVKTAVHDMDKFIVDNNEEIKSYIAFKQSEEYRASPACHLEQALRRFNSTSGYNEIFIPALCRLSESYRKYYEELMPADETFTQRFSKQE